MSNNINGIVKIFFLSKWKIIWSIPDVHKALIHAFWRISNRFRTPLLSIHILQPKCQGEIVEIRAIQFSSFSLYFREGRDSEIAPTRRETYASGEN